MKKGTLVVITSKTTNQVCIAEYEGDVSTHYVVTNMQGLLDVYSKVNYTIEEVKIAESK